MSYKKKPNTNRKDCSELSNLAKKVDQADFKKRKEYIRLIDESVDR